MRVGEVSCGKARSKDVRPGEIGEIWEGEVRRGKLRQGSSNQTTMARSAVAQCLDTSHGQQYFSKNHFFRRAPEKNRGRAAKFLLAHLCMGLR